MNDPTISNDVSNDAPDNRKGTGFTNLQKYLGANSNNNLDQYLGSQISNEAGNYRNDLNSAQSQFQNDLSAQDQNLQNNQQNANNTLNSFSLTPTNASTGQTGSTAGSLAQPTDASGNYDATTAYNNALSQYTPSDDTVKAFQSYMNPTYNGPSGLSNSDQLRATAQNLNSMGTQSNPQGLLSRYLGGARGYTSGQQNFDSMLLGNANNTKQSLSQLRSINPNSIDAMAQGDQSAAQSVQNRQQGLANNIRSQLGIDQNNLALPDDTGNGLLQQYDKNSRFTA
jgi:hypothetical protein